MKIIYTILFLLITSLIAYTGFVWLGGGSAGPSFVFKGPEEILIGVPFTLEVGISNDSGKILQNANLSLKLPRGVAFANKGSDENLIVRKLGNLGIGSLISENFSLVVLEADIGDSKEIKAGVDYSVESSGSRFENNQAWQIKISGSAAKLTIDTSDQIVSGGQLSLKINYENISPAELDNLVLKIDYPDAFKFEKSTLKPDENNNLWKLGNLHPGSKGTITVLGKVVGLERSSHAFKVSLGTSLDNQVYVIDQQIINTTIKATPLSLEILANDVSEYVASPGDIIEYTIKYSYLDQPAKSAVITASFKGAMFDGNPVLRWDLNNLEKSGLIKFKIPIKSNYPISRLGDRNFILELDAQMDDGKQIAIAQHEVKINGRINLRNKAFFRDAASGILNSGPFPPKVDQATQFTIHWVLTNYSNDAQNVVVKARLPLYVKFTGISAGDREGNLRYNSSSREMIWEIDQVSATRGVISDPLEAVFQIEAVPPAESIGQYLKLLEETVVNATDEFTGFPLSDKKLFIDTRLPDDQTIEGEGLVR